MRLSEILSNPVRLRIFQYLQDSGEATTKQISEALDDVPVPTLYRHVNRLLDEGLLRVVSERKVRGSVERTIAINEDEWSEKVNSDIADTAYQFLMTLYQGFREYSSGDDVDPMRDRLSLRTCMLRMSDEEMDDFAREYSELLAKYRGRRSDGRTRSISIVSSPVFEEMERW